MPEAWECGSFPRLGGFIMLCRVALFTSLVLSFTSLPGGGRAVAQEDPSVRGRKASEWLEMLRTDPKADRRRGALIALGILGPKVPGVLPGVTAALKDADAAVRRGAAQALGQMGPD